MSTHCRGVRCDPDVGFGAEATDSAGPKSRSAASPSTRLRWPPLSRVARRPAGPRRLPTTGGLGTAWRARLPGSAASGATQPRGSAALARGSRWMTPEAAAAGRGPSGAGAPGGSVACDAPAGPRRRRGQWPPAVARKVPATGTADAQRLASDCAPARCSRTSTGTLRPGGRHITDRRTSRRRP
jgi:hypothetical protein